MLTGTATLFSIRALRAVARARSSSILPASRGVYDVRALTEDNELTLGLKHLGYQCVSPKACTVGTEVMPTLSRLFRQRSRWQRGALDNLFAYGLTRSTAPYVGRQILTYGAVAFVPFFLTTLSYAWVSRGAISWSWFWVYVTAFVAFERVWSVKRGGWRSLLVAGLLVPEIVYDLFLHVVYITVLTDIARGDRRTWDYRKENQQIARGWWKRKRSAGIVYAGLLLAIVEGLDAACIAMGVAWLLIGIVVLGGAVFAAIRLVGLDLFGVFLGTGEQSGINYSLTGNETQGFGGLDVPADAADLWDWKVVGSPTKPLPLHDLP